MARAVLASFWDGRDAHQATDVSLAEADDCGAGVSVACMAKGGEKPDVPDET